MWTHLRLLTTVLVRTERSVNRQRKTGQKEVRIPLPSFYEIPCPKTQERLCLLSPYFFNWLVLAKEAAQGEFSRQHECVTKRFFQDVCRVNI